MNQGSRRNFLRQVGCGIAVAGTHSSLAKRPTLAQPTNDFLVDVIGRTGRGNYGHDLDVAWLEVPQATLVAVADDNEAGRVQAAKRLGVSRSYADYREMLEKEKPDIVTVAPRWPDCHREMVVAAAEAGCHILMEKPFSQTLKEADEMLDACERNRVKLAIAHQTRYSPRLDQVRKLIDDGRLGDLVELRGRGKGDRRAGGEDLIVLGSHIMDLMRFVAGDPQWCLAHVTESGKPIAISDVRQGGEPVGPIAGNQVTAMFGFAPPTIGFFGSHPARHHAATRFGLSIYGTKGIVTLGTGTLPDAFFIDDPTWQPGKSQKSWVPVTSRGLGQPEPLTDRSLRAGNVRICRDLIRAIETDTQPRCGVRDARWTIEMITAVYRSHIEAGRVDLPLAERDHPLMS